MINDRWKEPGLPRNAVTDALVRAVGAVVQAVAVIPEQRKHLTFASPKHCDFRTPEYDVLRTASDAQVGAGPGRRALVRGQPPRAPEDIISESELIQMFCDVVAKNGNLLIGVGPRPDGTIPEEQQAPLRGLGAWLDVNGEAIYGSRPWLVTESEQRTGRRCASPRAARASTRWCWGRPGRAGSPCGPSTAQRVRRVRLVGADTPLEWSVEPGGDLSVTLPPGCRRRR